MESKECRICLRYEQNCVSLFAKRRGTKLAEIVRFCARVEISEDDGLPGNACGRCVNEALNAYLFVNKCRRSDAELRTAQASFKEECEEDGSKNDDPEPPDICVIVENNRSNNCVVDEVPLPTEQSAPSCDSVIGQEDVDKSAVIETESEDNMVLFQESVPYELSAEVDYEATSLKILHKTSNDEEDVGAPISHIKEESSDGIYENEEDNREDQYLVEYLDESFGNDMSDAIEEIDYIEDDAEKDSLQETTLDGTIQPIVCCGIRCRAVFNTFQELTSHSNEVHLPLKEPESKEKPYECLRCYCRFSSEKSIAMHMRKMQYCPICLQFFYSIKEKQVHMHATHGQSVTVAGKQSSQKICCGCHKEFDSAQDLRDHSEKVHSIRKNAMDETKPFQCDICYKLFRTFESLRIHQRFVYRPKNFACDVCDRAFDTRSKLLTHQLVHSDQRNFQCDKCEKSFKKDIDLKSHLLLHDEKREECAVCGLKFHRKSNLKMHMRKHQNTFFYACPECPKKFKNNSHLKEHFKVHSKQKPYPCSFCERSFAYCSDRKRHEMTHTGNYPFECLCSKKFARKTTYEKHIAHCQEDMLPYNAD